MNVTITLTEIECCNCHTIFAMTRELYDRFLNELPRKNFFCPRGHQQHFLGDTEEQRLRRKLASAEQDVAFYKTHASSLQGSLSATKGVVTKLKKKIVAGVCPVEDCRRHFSNVERHIHRMHPGWEAAEA